MKSDRLRALLVGAALGVVWSAAVAVRDGTWLVAPLVLVSSALASAALPSPAKWSRPHQRVLVGFLLPLIVALIGATFVGVPFLVAGGLDWEGDDGALAQAASLLFFAPFLALAAYASAFVVALPAGIVHAELLFRVDRAARRRLGAPGP